MARYHINPQGNPGLCRARVQCPFGDLEGDHYDSPDQARQAYEYRMNERVDYDQKAKFALARLDQTESELRQARGEAREAKAQGVEDSALNNLFRIAGRAQRMYNYCYEKAYKAQSETHPRVVTAREKLASAVRAETEAMRDDLRDTSQPAYLVWARTGAQRKEAEQELQFARAAAYQEFWAQRPALTPASSL